MAGGQRTLGTLKIEGIVFDKRWWITVDTATATTLINQDFRDALPEQIRKAKRPVDDGFMLSHAEGQEMKMDRQYDFVLILGKEHFRVTAICVPSLACAFLLGNDWLDENGAVVDYSKKEVRVKGTTTPSVISGKEDRLAVLKVESTVVIPPRSEKLIYARAEVARPQSWQAGTVVMVEPNSYLVEKMGCGFARAVVKYAEDRIPVRLLNMHREPIKLYASTSIGTVEHVATHSIQAVESEVTPREQLTKLSQVNNLTTLQQKQLADLLHEFQDLFITNTSPPGRTDITRHTIKTPEYRPINQQPYRVSPKENEIIEKAVNKMLKDEVIRASTSPWASPVVLAKKPDGTFRFCVDYRKLNSITERDVYPLPRIDDTLDFLGKNLFFSTMDLAHGYWQILMSDEDRAKTAFICKQGLFEFDVMPFGLTNAPATFQRTMDIVLSGLKWINCLVYLDDIIVFSATFEEHLQHLRKVFERIRKAGLKFRTSKCQFAQHELKYLGFQISPNGLSPLEAKIQAVKEFPVPRAVKEVKQFLGLANYYRRFISHFSDKAMPLNDLLIQNRTFEWTEECQESFDILRNALISAPILAYPDFNKPFLLMTDASATGLGVVLSQQSEDKQEKVIAYASRVLQPAERNYSVTERECLAVVWAVQHFRPYLYGQPFDIITDHSALQSILKTQRPNGRVARWIMTLQEFNYNILYRKGSQNGNADALSRMHEMPEESALVLAIFSHDMEDLKLMQERDQELVEFRIGNVKHRTILYGEWHFKKMVSEDWCQQKSRQVQTDSIATSF